MDNPDPSNLTDDGRMMLKEWDRQFSDIVDENNEIFEATEARPIVLVLMHPYAYVTIIAFSELTTQQKATSLKIEHFSLDSDHWEVIVKLCDNLPCTWIVYR